MAVYFADILVLIGNLTAARPKLLFDFIRVFLCYSYASIWLKLWRKLTSIAKTLTYGSFEPEYMAFVYSRFHI